LEFLHYKAGDFRSEWRTGQEYVQADYLDPWWQIVVGYPGITEQEISDITRGPLRLGFVRINDSLFSSKPETIPGLTHLMNRGLK